VTRQSGVEHRKVVALERIADALETIGVAMTHKPVAVMVNGRAERPTTIEEIDQEQNQYLENFKLRHGLKQPETDEVEPMNEAD
jgi:hypothetical protein